MEIVCKPVSFRAARGNWVHLGPNFSILTGCEGHGVYVCERGVGGGKINRGREEEGWGRREE